MKLYLQRHAEAEAGLPLDPARQLTSVGEHEVAVMSDWMVRQIGRVDLVVSSGFTRAIHTAVPMAQALGCRKVETTPHLDPDGDPKVAWHDILSLAKQKTENADEAHVLVVSHHPLINKLAQHLCGVTTDDDHFRHGAVMHIHASKPGASVLEYFVPPKVVEREQAIAESALAAAEAALELQAPSGLKHPRHASRLKPIKAAAHKPLERFFKKQGRVFAKHIRSRLHALSVHEAGVEDDKAKAAAAGVLPDGYVMPLVLTDGMAADYGKALSAALSAGYDVLASDYDSTGQLAPDFIETYLRNHSLAKLTGELNRTSVDRLQDALADAYKAGADYDELVETIKDEFADFSTTRTKRIAQTEMNNAYNSGRKQLGLDLGFNEKSWSADGPAPCPECIGNVLDGWIAMDEPFSSGDSAPTAHPGCYCSLDVRLNPQAQ